METHPIMPGAEPFFFEGNEIGVIVSHGFTGTTQSVRFLGQYLAEKGGFTVIGPRLRGHGTHPEDMARSSAEDWVRSIEEAMETLQAKCKQLFITGLSMGGTLSLYMAGMYPEAFRGTAPINAALFLNNPLFARLAFGRNLPETIPGVGADIKQPGVTELVYPVVPVPAVRQIYALMGVTRDLLSAITCPVLLFHSREDHVVPPENATFIYEHLTCSDKELVWLENSYHVATLDYDKELIAEKVLAFIQRLAGA